MKKLIIFGVLAFGFSACTGFPPVAGNTPSPSATATATAATTPQPARASVSFKKVDLTGGEKDLYVVVDGRDYYLMRVKWFNPTSRGDYADSGIPRSAASAGSFSDSSEPEDSQGIYAADTGSGVTVYTGYYDPGYMHDVNWSVLKVISR